MIVVYGATGYTGALVAGHLAQRGLRPVLAGRHAAALAAVAEPWGLDVLVGSLDDIDLTGATALLNCAGPFDRTQPPLLAACLQARVHYLDLAGEVAEHLGASRHDEQARAAGILVLPGAGFGIVPSDCLITHVVAAVPEAVGVDLALKTVGGVSRGTASVVLGGLRTPGVARVDGLLQQRRAGAQTLRVDFGDGDGPTTVATNPWRGDLAAVASQVPNMQAYMAFPAPVRALMHIPHGGTLRAIARRLPRGPSRMSLDRGRSAVWARATGADGSTATASLTGPDAYLFTALTAEACLRRIVTGDAPAGHHTPAAIWGSGLLTELPGVQWRDQARRG